MPPTQPRTVLLPVMSRRGGVLPVAVGSKTRMLETPETTLAT